MARIPFVERNLYGQDDLTRKHRLVGFTSFSLLLAHLVLITLGYAANTSLGLVGTFVDLVLAYPDVAGLRRHAAVPTMVVVTSIRRPAGRWVVRVLAPSTSSPTSAPGSRCRTKRGTGDFLSSTAATAFGGAVGGRPARRARLPGRYAAVARSMRHRLRRLRGHRRAARLTTVVVTVAGQAEALPGPRHVLPVGAFLGVPGWTRAHPYWLSAAPSRPVTAFHRRARRRRLRCGGRPAPRDAGPRRGSVRAAARRRPAASQGAAHGGPASA